MEEIWKEIPGFNGKYQVSNFGRVKSLPNLFHAHEIIMKQGNNVHGYKLVNLTFPNHKQKVFTVHRLVASAFIPNPKNLEQVNHIDGDKSNNVVSNLEWIDRSGNAVHSRDILKNDPGCCIDEPVKCVETGVVYKSVREAGEETGLNPKGIAVVANGGTSRRTCGGLHWEYFDRRPKPYAPKPKFNPPRYAYKIQCVETGEIYNGSHEAAKAIGGCQTSIARAAREPHRMSAGCHWKQLSKIDVKS